MFSLNNAWIKPLKDKNGKIVLNNFIGKGNVSKRKPNKLCVDQGREFHNNLFQKQIDDSHTLMHSTHNEGKSVAAERYIRTFTE